MEAAISALLGEPIALTSAGRTDTGVHACGQVVSFTTARIAFPWDRFALALHTRLPRDIRVRDVATVAPDFSARFSALRRRYIYAILARPLPSALLARYAWHLYRPLDIAAMRAAALPLVGEHDFRSFCGTLPENGNTVRRIESLTIEPRGELTIVRVAANAFLHRMVRTIVGLLAECAMGRRSPESVAAILAARDRAAAGVTAPAYGLYFAGVAYPDGYDSFAEPPMLGSTLGTSHEGDTA